MRLLRSGATQLADQATNANRETQYPETDVLRLAGEVVVTDEHIHCDRYWLLTSTTYGNWLPGDSRGFVSNVRVDDDTEVRDNIPGTP